MNEPQHPSEETVFSYKIRACEACRHRKAHLNRLPLCLPSDNRQIKCDRLAPCSSCRTLDIPCRTAGPAAKKRLRESTSDRWEEKFEMIDARLSRLDITLQRFIDGERSRNAQKLTNIESSSHAGGSGAADVQAGSLEVSLEDSFSNSFDIRSGETGTFLESAISISASSDSRNRPSTSSNTLPKPPRTDRPCSHTHFSHNLPIPSRDLILKGVRLAKGTKQRLMLASSLIDLDILIEKSQRVYFPIDGYSSADFIMVHAGLLSIIRVAGECDIRQLDLSPLDAQETINLCQENINAALEQLNLFLQPCLDNIVALALGAQVALEKSKLSMAWKLTSMSARLCLDAGLHRLEDSCDNSQLNYKKRCFWHVYCLDKILALNFGRVSNLHDIDISTGYPNSYPWLSSNPWHTMSYIFIDSSRIRSQISEKLYSAQGQKQDAASKEASVRSIAAEIERLIAICKSDFGDVLCADDFHAIIETFLMTLYSILALVYSSVRPTQASNPLDFSVECISTARTCLQLHCELSTRFMAQRDDFWRMYIDWGLLSCPFMPFLALLCAAISNPDDQRDKRLLSDVVASLQVAAERAPGAGKLYNICRMLHQNALRSIDEGRRLVSFQPGTNLTQRDSRNLHTDSLNHSQQSRSVYASEQQNLITPSGFQDDVTVFTANANAQATLTASDNAREMSMWFEDYFGGNTTMLDIVETDQAQMNWDWANL